MARTNTRWAVSAGILAILLIVLISVLVVVLLRRPIVADNSKIDSRYQAVLLDTGAVYFGRMEKLEEPFITLREVYYVQSGTNPTTKETSNVLVKRGKELHGPDYMRINTRHVVLVEPVSENSKVAQLIAESARSR